MPRFDTDDALEFTFDETVVFDNDGLVWDDLRVSLERGKAIGANQPAWTKLADNGAGSAGVYAWLFDDGDEIWFAVQMPHSWKEGTVVYPHLHWCPESDVDPADNVGIGLEYWVADIGEDFPANTTIVTRDVSTGVNNDRHHLIHNFDAAGIDMTGFTISHVWMCRFFRQAAVADNYADGIFALYIDFHFQKDTVGSRQVTSK